MKKLKRRIQTLKQHANTIKEVLDVAPAKAAEIREALGESVKDFQRLKHEIMVGGSAVPDVLGELTSLAPLLADAGFELTGVDYKVDMDSDLLLHLERQEDCNPGKLWKLMQGSTASSSPVVDAVIQAILQAEETAAKMKLPDLHYRELQVEVGMRPTIRLCWRAEEEEPEPPPAPAIVQTPMRVSVSTPESAPTQELPSTPARPPVEEVVSLESLMARPEKSAPTPSAPPAPTAPVLTPRSTATGRDRWSASALDRFKKMPEIS